MDKGLIKIQELNKQLEQLNLEKSQNDLNIREEVEESAILEEEIFDLDKEIETKSNEKTKFENAPKDRKKEKKEEILIKLLAYLFLLVVVSIFFFESTSFLPAVLFITGGSALASIISIPIQFNAINKKYPIGNIPELEQEIEGLRGRLSNSVSRKNNVDFKLENSKELRKTLETQIQKLLQEKTSIETLRAKVIEEYCNNNPELEEKIDKAYDEDVKAKVKVNK